MSPTTAPTPDIIRDPCPTRRVSLALPLATIEELDKLAAGNRISREEILQQIINAGLLSEHPHLPSGPDPIAQLAQRAPAIHRRSLEIAASTAVARG